MALALLAAACDEDPNAGGGGAFAISEYFAGATAWTWRDPSGDADSGDTAVTLDDAALLRAEMGDDGVMEVRRGARFADGTKVGSLTWDPVATDLVLAAWSWGSDGSGDSTFLARNGGLPGETVANLQGSCVADTADGLETYYGTFEYALVCTCTGTHSPDGSYWFAKGFGLVKADTTEFSLDLVAPR